MQLLHKIELNNPGPSSPAFDPQGSILAVNSFHQGIVLLDFDTGALLQKIDHGSNYRGAMNFSSTDSTLISASDDGVIQLWQCEDTAWRLVKHVKGEAGRILSVAMHSDGDTILRVNATTRKVEICSLTAGELLKTYSFGYAAFHPNQPFVAIRKRERLVVINYITDEVIFNAYVGDHFSPVAFGNDGKYIVVINDSGEVVILDFLTQSRKILTLRGDYAVKVSVAVNKNIVCGLDETGTIAIWDLNDGKLKERAYTELYQPNGLAVSYQGDFLAIGSGPLDNGVIEVWQLGD